MKRSLLLSVLVVALALPGCGNAGSTTAVGTASGHTPAPRSSTVDPGFIAKLEGAAR
jgi:hypothetical protein